MCISPANPHWVWPSIGQLRGCLNAPGATPPPPLGAASHHRCGASGRHPPPSPSEANQKSWENHGKTYGSDGKTLGKPEKNTYQTERHGKNHVI